MVNPRVAFIWKNTPRPNASKVFLDYVLSSAGQGILAQSLFSMRPDVDGPFSAKALLARYGDRLRPLGLDETVVEYLQQKKRLEFLSTWRKSIETR